MNKLIESLKAMVLTEYRLWIHDVTLEQLAAAIPEGYEVVDFKTPDCEAPYIGVSKGVLRMLDCPFITSTTSRRLILRRIKKPDVVLKWVRHGIVRPGETFKSGRGDFLFAVCPTMTEHDIYEMQEVPATN